MSISAPDPLGLCSRLGLAAMLAMAVHAGAYAQQPEPAPAAPAESEHRDDTAGKSTTELAKEIQNPIADLISVPFQNNANFNYGPLKGTQDILNIQPVIPIHLNEDWNLITRTIFPLIWQPALAPNTGSTFGRAAQCRLPSGKDLLVVRVIHTIQ